MNTPNTFSLFIRDVTLGKPTSFDNLTVYPVMAPEGLKEKFISLDEALSKGFIEISEINKGGNVNNLRVINKASTHRATCFLNSTVTFGGLS